MKNKEGNSLEVRIGSSINEYIVLIIQKRSHPNSWNSSDLNWLNVEVLVSVGGFRCDLRQYLHIDEISSFKNKLEKLYNTLIGIAELTSMESWIYLKLEGDGRGHIICHGDLNDGMYYDNFLKFKFNLDQTHLPDAIRSLEEVLEAYPIIRTESHSPDKNKESFLRNIFH